MRGCVVPLRPCGVDPELPELVLVEAWRADRLLAAGFPDEVAVALAADHGVDVHVAVGLLEQGCPLVTALRILAPVAA